MKKVLSIFGMISPFLFGVLWILSSIFLNEYSISDTSFMIKILYVKTFSGIAFLSGIIAMLVSIIYLGREKGLTLKEVIVPSWKMTRNNIWKYVLGVFLVFILQIVQNELTNPNSPETIFSLLVLFIAGILYMRIDFGLKNLSISLINKNNVKTLDLFVSPQKFFNYFLAYIIIVFFVLLGLLFFIVPGIFIGLRLNMVPYIILEENIGPWKAIKKSWELTKAKIANLLSLNIVLGAINILGLFALVVGLFWTIPLFYIANAMFYKKLILLKK